jgi:hypothetical protein
MWPAMRAGLSRLYNLVTLRFSEGQDTDRGVGGEYRAVLTQVVSKNLSRFRLFFLTYLFLAHAESAWEGALMFVRRQRSAR